MFSNSVDLPDISVKSWGIAWYWAVTAIFTICGVGFMCPLYTSRNTQVKRLCCMTAICCYVASMCYFLMARRSGWVAIEVEFVREGQTAIAQGQPTRQIFWIRYVSWLVMTPILMTELFLLVSSSIETILLDAFLSIVVMLTGLAGACDPGSSKWVWYAYGSIACTGIGFQIFFTGYKLASAKGRELRVQYLRCSLLMTILWVGYGIVWPLGEGANLVSPDVEAVLYGILDVLGCVVFGAMVAFSASQYSVEG
ncbi:hypothetical protein Q7P35_011488 [Cladosporium inversicolor]